MDLDDLDIYDDLDAFQEKEEKKSTELLKLEEKYKESLETIEALRLEVKTLRKQQKTMEVNFQNLLDTAKAELKRKDQQITQLRKEKDDICFRRKNVKPPPGSFQKDYSHNEEHHHQQHRKNSATHTNPFANHHVPSVPVPEAQPAEISKEHKNEHLPVGSPAADISHNKRQRSSFNGAQFEKQTAPHKHEPHHKRPRLEEPKAPRMHDRSADEHRHVTVKDSHHKDHRSHEHDRHNEKPGNRHDSRYGPEKSRRDPRNLLDNRKSVYRDHNFDENEQEPKRVRERERPKDPRDVSDSSRQKRESSNSMERSTKEFSKNFQQRKVTFKEVSNRSNSTIESKESTVIREPNEIKLPKDTDDPKKSIQAISSDSEVRNITKTIVNKVSSTSQEKLKEEHEAEQKPICSKNLVASKNENKINIQDKTETEIVQDIFAKARSSTLKSKQSDTENQTISVTKSESIEQKELLKTASMTPQKIDENSNHAVALNTPKKVALFDALFGPSPGAQNDSSKLLTNVIQIINSDSASTSPGGFSEANDLESKDGNSMKNSDGKTKEEKKITASVVESYFTENKKVPNETKSETKLESTKNKNIDSFFEKVFEELEFDSIPGLSSENISSENTETIPGLSSAKVSPGKCEKIPDLSSAKVTSDESENVLYEKLEDDTDIDNTDEENVNNAMIAIESKDDNATDDNEKPMNANSTTKKASIVIIEDIRLPDVLPIDELLKTQEAIGEKTNSNNHESTDDVETQAENKKNIKRNSSQSTPSENIDKEAEIPHGSINQEKPLGSENKIELNVTKCLENVNESEIDDNSKTKSDEVPKEVLTENQKQSENVKETIISGKMESDKSDVENPKQPERISLQKSNKISKLDDIQETLTHLREEVAKIIDEKAFDDNEDIRNEKLLINTKPDSEKPPTNSKEALKPDSKDNKINIDSKNTENKLCNKSKKSDTEIKSVEIENDDKNHRENKNTVKNNIKEKSSATTNEKLNKSSEKIGSPKETSNVMNKELDTNVKEHNEKLNSKSRLNTSNESTKSDIRIIKDSIESNLKSVEVIAIDKKFVNDVNIPSEEKNLNISKDAKISSDKEESEKNPQISVQDGDNKNELSATHDMPPEAKSTAVETCEDVTNEQHNSETDSSFGSSTENNAVSFLKHSFGQLISNERSKKKPPAKLKNFIKLNIPTPKARKRKLQEAKDEKAIKIDEKEKKVNKIDEREKTVTKIDEKEKKVTKIDEKEKIKKQDDVFKEEHIKQTSEVETSLKTEIVEKNSLSNELITNDDADLKQNEEIKEKVSKVDKERVKTEKNSKDDRKNSSKHEKSTEEIKDLKSEKAEGCGKTIKTKTGQSEKKIPSKNSSKTNLGRVSKNTRRILDSSSDEEETTEPRKPEAPAVPEEVKQPIAADKPAEKVVEVKVKRNRKRIIQNTSSDESSKQDTSLEAPQREENCMKCTTPPTDHSIFHQDQVNKLAHPLPQFNNLQDIQYKDIDLRLQTMFQSPPYVADKVPVILPPQSTDLPQDTATPSALNETFDDENVKNINLSTVTIDETLSTSTMGEHSSMNDTTSSLETKRLSLGHSEYLFEKVSDNVVNVFITRKRHKKKNKSIVSSSSAAPLVVGGGPHPSI